MELLTFDLDLVVSIVVFIFGYFLCIPLIKKFLVRPNRALILYVWHTIFCLLYAKVVVSGGGDSTMYYKTSLLHDTEFFFGTSAVIFLTSIFSYYLGFSFISCFLVFNVFGYIGLLAFDASLGTLVKNESRTLKRLATLIVFLPSVSFWSAAIGKDALSFLAAGLALWAAIDLQRRLWGMVPAVLVMLLVRPHMAGMLVMALALSVLSQRGLSIPQRLLAVGVVAAAIAILVPFSLDYAGVGRGASPTEIIEYIEVRQGFNMEGGGGIDISSMPVPWMLFTYMFRPLPFEAFSVYSLAASLDNVVLICVFVAGGIAMFKRKRPYQQENRVFLWSYSLTAWLILASMCANMGISARQKWMFAPMLIFLLISAMVRARMPATAPNG